MPDKYTPSWMPAAFQANELQNSTKYGVDIAHPFNWQLFPFRPAELKAQHPEEVFQNQQILAANQRAENMTNAGEWLMTLPFSMVPTKVPLKIMAPSWQQINTEPLPREIINTRSSYNSRGVYPASNKQPWIENGNPYQILLDGKVSLGNQAMMPQDFNQPQVPATTFSAKRGLPPVTILDPQAKLDLLGRAVTTAAKLGSYLTPEPLKQQLPPNWRGLLHYLSGRGTPSSLNLTMADLIRDPGLATPISRIDLSRAVDGWRSADPEYINEDPGWHTGLRNAISHPAIRSIVRDPLSVYGINGLTSETAQPIRNALGKFYYDPTSRTAFDDYRFFPIDQTPMAADRWKTVKDVIFGGRIPEERPATTGAGLEQWLSTLGKPFPVIIKDKK
jgi:hypothetical protein